MTPVETMTTEELLTFAKIRRKLGLLLYAGEAKPLDEANKPAKSMLDKAALKDLLGKKRLGLGCRDRREVRRGH